MNHRVSLQKEQSFRASSSRYGGLERGWSRTGERARGACSETGSCRSLRRPGGSGGTQGSGSHSCLAIGRKGFISFVNCLLKNTRPKKCCVRYEWWAASPWPHHREWREDNMKMLITVVISRFQLTALPLEAGWMTCQKITISKNTSIISSLKHFLNSFARKQDCPLQDKQD